MMATMTKPGEGEGLSRRLHRDDETNRLWLLTEDSAGGEVRSLCLGHPSVASDADLPDDCPESVRDEFHDLTGAYFDEQDRIGAIR